MDQSWPARMQLESVTQVSISYGILNSQDAESVAEFMSALQRQCVSHYFALSINIQQRQGGVTEIIAHTLLSKAAVYALAASGKPVSQDCTVLVDTVPPAALGNTNVVMWQLRNLRVNHGH